jgi:phosphosulfolactate phosphohydrolase-like enzyme
LAASFLNLTATAEFIKKNQPAQVLLVCAGTRENTALEDVLAAGALCEMLSGEFSDSAEIVRRVYAQAKPDLAGAVRLAENARRLLSLPELRDDVSFCMQRDTYPLVAKMEADGTVRAQ